ncbi:MAG TPA: hypothetical protein VGH31_06835, partial [Acidimicrobiales bacterium]
MIVDHIEGEGSGIAEQPAPGLDITIPLGRRIMVVGDLLLPTEPSASSLAGSHDLATTLADWQGPGHLVLCGQLGSLELDQPADTAAAVTAHGELVTALTQFAARTDSQVIVVVPDLADTGELGTLLTSFGATVSEGVDLHCNTGA